MKVRWSILVGLVGTLAACSTSESINAEGVTTLPVSLGWGQRLADPRVIIEAHRACYREVGENTLGGIKVCADHGIDAVEVDVAVTKDGVLVLMHDATLDRTTTMKGRVDSYTYDELRNARVREHNGGPDAVPLDEPIPTLSEALRAAKGRIHVILDIKAHQAYKQIVDMVVAENMQDEVSVLWMPAIDPKGFDFLPVSMRQSFGPHGFANCAEPIGTVNCVNSLTEGIRLFEGVARPIKVRPGFSMDSAFMRDAEILSEQNGIRLEGHILKGEAEDPDQWQQVLNLGHDILFTDKPLELAEYLKVKGLR